MQPMIAAESGFDLQQIIFVIVFVLVGFVQWVFKLWQEKREEAERKRHPAPSAEEIEARRRAWQKQAGSGPDAAAESSPPPLPASPSARSSPVPQNPTPPIPPVTAPSGGLGELIDTFRKAMQEAQESQNNPPPSQSPTRTPSFPQTPPQTSAPEVVGRTPPPLPSSPPVTSSPYAISTRESHPNQRQQAVELLAPLPPIDSYAIKPPNLSDSHTKRRTTHSLTQYLRETGGYRKAFILKEVLNAPKALQKSPWPVD